MSCLFKYNCVGQGHTPHSISRDLVHRIRYLFFTVVVPKRHSPSALGLRCSRYESNTAQYSKVMLHLHAKNVSFPPTLFHLAPTPPSLRFPSPVKASQKCEAFRVLLWLLWGGKCCTGYEDAHVVVKWVGRWVGGSRQE